MLETVQKESHSYNHSIKKNNNNITIFIEINLFKNPSYGNTIYNKNNNTE